MNSGPIMDIDILTISRKVNNVQYPALWYGLWMVISFCGVMTWYLRNFTQRIQLTKFIALIGVASMISMVLWTFIEF